MLVEPELYIYTAPVPTAPAAAFFYVLEICQIVLLGKLMHLTINKDKNLTI
jgi:hypothetical protein